MRILWLALLLIAAPAFACEFSFGVGVTAKAVQVGASREIHAMCVFKDKYELSATYFNEQTLYDGWVRVKPYISIAGARRWAWREGKAFQPFTLLGLAFKEAQTCPNTKEAAVLLGSKKCNRIAPLPVEFLLGVGFRTGDFEIAYRHMSNAGFSEVNLGQDWVGATYRFR